jgi:hypothetical protein
MQTNEFYGGHIARTSDLAVIYKSRCDHIVGGDSTAAQDGSINVGESERFPLEAKCPLR